MTRTTQEKRGNPILIRGKAYPSQAAAARAYGVSCAAISYARSRGALDRVGLTTRLRETASECADPPATIAPTEPSSVQRVSLHKHLLPIFHPRWCPRDDLALVRAKAAGRNFSEIAQSLGRSRIAVEQRWHRLRNVPDIEKHLKAYQPLGAPYPVAGLSVAPEEPVSRIQTRDQSGAAVLTRSDGGIDHEY
ncbi:hypothetical protein [Yoonia sp. I 8.24]|uniref:hypothetical protein n=1 Tax=Yoonia sp. I 8.24 TaxID=1537229 RepID=UPI001EDD9EE2|nr:hypothetical protein [Yoonia sp. I 8.24]MCG3267764.1 hypothetical protein [Yoonia sp. I 8.24]